MNFMTALLKSASYIVYRRKILGVTVYPKVKDPKSCSLKSRVLNHCSSKTL